MAFEFAACSLVLLATAEPPSSSIQVKQLRSLGKDPYAYKYDRTHTAAQLQQQFEDLPSGQIAEDASPVSVAGRVRARRFMGKLAFATLADDSGEVQLYLEKTALDAAAPDTFKYIQLSSQPAVTVDACSMPCTLFLHSDDGQPFVTGKLHTQVLFSKCAAMATENALPCFLQAHEDAA